MATAPPNILVVEDDRETRALIAKYLRSNACNVTTANDGREMVRAMTDHRVDLVILDVMLPGEDGLSLCRKVRAESQTPIIMLTARGEDVDRILGLEMGADDYLAKPFNPRELLARINAVMRRHTASQTVSASNGATALSFLGWRIDFRLRELRNPAGARGAMTSGAPSASVPAACCRATACSISRKGATPVHSNAVSMCWSAVSGARSNPIHRSPP